MKDNGFGQIDLKELIERERIRTAENLRTRIEQIQDRVVNRCSRAIKS